MTNYNFNCKNCGEQNSVEVIDDVDDIPTDDYKRIKKFVDWEYSSQMYEHLWDDDSFLDTQVLHTYLTMQENREHAEDIRLFCDEILYTNWMQLSFDEQKKYGTGFGGYLRKYKDQNPTFLREISTSTK
jgi:hypothetical protein